MTIIIEIDTQYAGFGVDWFSYIKGVRLGYVAIHFILMPYEEYVKRTGEG